MAVTEQCGYNILGGDNAEQETTAVMEYWKWDEEYDHIKSFTFMVEAEYNCSKCNFKWSSHTTTIEIDLMRRCILKKYRRKCKRCENYWALPRIRSDEFKNTFRDAMEYSVEAENPERLAQLTLGDKGPLTPDHIEEHCERCIQLGELCYVGGRKPVETTVSFGPTQSCITVFRQVPHVMASFIHEHLHLLNQVLAEMLAAIKVYMDSQSSFIHIIPTKNSRSIENWNKICESKLNKFLRGLDCQSLSLRPELLPRLQEVIKEIKLDTFLHIEQQNIIHITGESQEVKKTLENVKRYMYRKPCIVPF